MKQIITRASFEANFGGATIWLPLLGGRGSWATGQFDETQSRCVWSCAGTFSRLVIHLPVAQAFATTWTILKNGVATSITVTLAAGATNGSDLTNTVAVVAGDAISLKLAGTASAGYNVACALQFTGSVTAQSGYSIPPFGGSMSSNPASDNARFGGAFGNGVFQSGTLASLGASLSGTYSIVSTHGTITRLDAVTYAGAPGAGVWTCSLRLNGVTQDGSGGTVNTVVTMTGATQSGSKTFSLPVAPGDHVDVLVARSALDAPFAVAQVGCGIAFTADTDDAFVLCGGDNATTDPAATTYMWNTSQQLETSEAAVKVPSGPIGFYLKGFYVERGAAPGTGKSWRHTVRVGSVDTALTLTIADLATSGSILGSVLVASSVFAALSMVPAHTPTPSPLHWAMVGFSGDEPIPPTPSGATYATRRVRRFPHVSALQTWIFWEQLQIDLQAGVGLSTGQGSDPQLMLRWSDDGGHTWSHEHWTSAGRQGQYARRAIWRTLGRSRDRVYELVVSDPVAWVFLQAIATIAQGRS